MIITLVKANFSANNIGALDSFAVLTNLGLGCTYNGPSSVAKNNAFSATISISDKYKLVTDGLIVSMGGNILSDAAVITDNLITFNIAEVTGAIIITVLTTTANNEVINYFDITTQGTQVGAIKDSVISYGGASLYTLTKVELPLNVIEVEYQAFKTGGSYGSAFVDEYGKVVKFFPRADVTSGDRVTEPVVAGAKYFYHMWDDPNNSELNLLPFTYIRVYTDGKPVWPEPEVPTEPVYYITEQTQKNYGLLDTATGVWSKQSYSDEQGGQTVTVCPIPADAVTVNYQVFKTGKTYGSGFFGANGEFISGYANTTEPAGTRKTLEIPAGAVEFWHMYPNRLYANGAGNCPEFDYIEFTKAEV